MSPIEAAKNQLFYPPYKFDLLTQATRLSLAYEYDHLLSLSNSRTNLEPYQVKAVYDVINAFRQRFLIADDVGLGKTVEAGMIIKELSVRGRANRVLIVVPAGLVPLWKREMSEKFDEKYWVYDSSKINDLKKNLSKGANVWEHDNKIITSIDYAKREEVLSGLERVEWDLVVFDEAHKLSVSKSGTKIKRTQRIKLAQALVERTESLLLLTATPHKGDRFAFFSLVRLIDPYLFEDEMHLDKNKVATIMIRRGKDGIKDENGMPVFKKRFVNTAPVHFLDAEMHLYQEVTQYVRENFNLAKRKKDKAFGFAMILFQKRMISSIHAIEHSLKRRLRAIAINEVTVPSIIEREVMDSYLKDPDSFSDEEKEELEGKVEKICMSLDSEELKKETDNLKYLVGLAEKIKIDSKAQELFRFVDSVLREDPKEKILIFTEYRDTLDYLRDKVFKDFSLVQIHGGMSMEERQESERKFRETDTNIMLATDAAGEGINLQFCHIMINYELPWNPNRIDQRIGRLHRYGQKRDVKAYNLLVENTAEGKIFIRLMDKVKQIEKDLGGKISEIIGTLLEGVKLQDKLMDAIAENVPVEVTYKDIEESINERKKMFETLESNCLMPLKDFDLEAAKKVIERSERKVMESATTNKDIEQFIRLFFDTHKGTIEPTRFKNIFRLITPQIVQDEGIIPNKYEKITFSKEIAKDTRPDEVDFIAFGHPLLNQSVRYCKDRDGIFGGSTTIKIIKESPYKEQKGILFNYILRYNDAKGNMLNESLVPIFVNIDGKLNNELSLEILKHKSEMDIENYIAGQDIKILISKMDELNAVALNHASSLSFNWINKVKEKIEREVNIQKEDVEKYFSVKKGAEGNRLKEYQERLSKGEDMAIAIERVKSVLNHLDEKYKSRMMELENRGKIYNQTPELLNLALVIFE